MIATIGLVLLLAFAGISMSDAVSRDLMSKGRALRQATATAIANANSNGGTAVSNSNAAAVSTGPPASSTVISNSNAGPGQTVVAECSAFAVNSNQYKECVGKQASPPTTPPAGGAGGSGGVTWATAPLCVLKPPTPSSPADAQGRLWGFENGKNCVYRTASGNPITSANINAAVLPQFATAPVCVAKPTTDNTKTDSNGSLWGFENGQSCAFKDGAGNPLHL